MYNLLENDVEQVSQLVTFAEGMLDYHQQCADILRVLVEVLREKREEAANRPKSEFVPKTLADLNIETLGSSDGVNGGSSRLNSPVNKPTHLELLGNGQAQARSTNASPLPSPMRSPARTPMPPSKPTQPHCTALYDFEPENPGELGFKVSSENLYWRFFSEEKSLNSVL
ncbi:endophilin-A-like [Uranotaenia lowii]|uniref:endophilin-A-like n=1 Tax=Uranotaenia lowii TaxID=190385 RepID=UPI00247944D6|nr:endophilin-A-like [Uranotaenia lowii]